MNKRIVIATALAAAVAAPSSSFGRWRPGADAVLQGREVLRPRQGRQERLRRDGQQLLRRHVEGQRRPEGLDLRPRRLLRPHRQRQQGAQGRRDIEDHASPAPPGRRAGVGLRLPHLAEVAATRPSAAWFEIHPENFLGQSARLGAAPGPCARLSDLGSHGRRFDRQCRRHRPPAS